MPKTVSTSERGRKGEEAAALWLLEQNWTVLEKNFRSKRGEIDLICIDKEVLVFVEVKTWTSWDVVELEQIISRTKQKRIIETAKYFLYLHRKYSNMSYRFDVVLAGASGIHHLAHAFTESV